MRMQNFKFKAGPRIFVLALSAVLLGAAGSARAAEAKEVKRYPGVMQQSVELWSDGTRLAGDLFYPKDREEGQKLPAIVLCHGWGGTKAHLNANIAPMFAAEGYVVLAFDYRGWGESDSRLVMLGEMPKVDEEGNVTVTAQAVRMVVDPFDQQEDIDAALSFMEGEPMADATRIGIWGSSFGGGHVIWRAAHDDRVACVVAQVGAMGSSGPGSMADRLRKMRTARARGHLEPVPQKEASPPGLTGHPYWDRIGRFFPGDFADRVTAPTLIVDAEKEHYFDIGKNGEKVHGVLKANGVETEYHVLKGRKHYDVYGGEPLKEIMALEIPWFNKHLRDAK